MDSKGPAAVWTGDNSVEETATTERTRNEEIHEPLNKGNGKNNLNKAKNANRVVNKLSVPTIDKETSERKKGNTVFTSVYTSSATQVKCSKNEDYNAHFRPCTTDRQEKKPSFKDRQDNRLTYQQYNSLIQQIPEITYRCEKTVLKCEKTLQPMNKLLRNSRIDNFWLRQHLQEMGIDFSQSAYNATFIPTGVGTPPSKPAAAACMPKSGNVESTMLSTELCERTCESPPARACQPGLTSCQARRDKDKLGRQPSRIIRSRTVGETTPIARITASTVFMSIPARSSFQSSTNSSFQNYARRLPAVRMARTKQTARKDRDDRQRGRFYQPERDRRRDRSNTPPRRARPRSPSPNVSSAYSVVRSVFNGGITDVTLSPNTTVAPMVRRRQRLTQKRQEGEILRNRPLATPDTSRASLWKQTLVMTRQQQDRVRPHLRKGDRRRHPEAVAISGHEASPLLHRRRNATRDASYPDQHPRHRRQSREQRRLLKQRRLEGNKYAESDSSKVKRLYRKKRAP